MQARLRYDDADGVSSSVIDHIPSLKATTEDRDGKTLLALSGAMIFPGAGHFLVGSCYMGLLWFALAVGIVLGCVETLADPRYIPMLAILVPAGAGVGLLQLLDALRAGRGSGKPVVNEPAFRYPIAIVILLSSLFWQHRVIAYLQNHVFEICYTPTPSMAPLLQVGDRFVTLKSLPVSRWDIVGFNCPPAYKGVAGDRWMKRVVGMPGEKVEITGNGVLINGKHMDLPAEAGPYLAIDRTGQPLAGRSRTFAANGCWGRPITLGADEYFLLGDNSLESTDARYWPSIEGHQPGAMPSDQITCKVIGICWPPALADVLISKCHPASG